MNRRISLCLAFFATLLAAPNFATGLCAMAQWSPHILTPKNQTLPRNGGVLVTAISSSSFRRGARPVGKYPSIMPLSIKRGKRTVKLLVDKLAPGLSRYTPRTPVAGTWQLVGVKGSHGVRFRKYKGAALPAPKVGAIKTHEQSWRGRRGRSTTLYAVAQISGKVPSNVIGVIVYAQRRKLVPMLFRRVPAGTWSGTGSRSFQLYRSPGRCSSDVRDTQRVTAGQTVQLRWVGRSGLLSPLSRPIRITKR